MQPWWVMLIELLTWKPIYSSNWLTGRAMSLADFREWTAWVFGLHIIKLNLYDLYDLFLANEPFWHSQWPKLYMLQVDAQPEIWILNGLCSVTFSFRANTVNLSFLMTSSLWSILLKNCLGVFCTKFWKYCWQCV